jgi:hypothetical protein
MAYTYVPVAPAHAHAPLGGSQRAHDRDVDDREAAGGGDDGNEDADSGASAGRLGSSAGGPQRHLPQLPPAVHVWGMDSAAPSPERAAHIIRHAMTLGATSAPVAGGNDRGGRNGSGASAPASTAPLKAALARTGVLVVADARHAPATLARQLAGSLRAASDVVRALTQELPASDAAELAAAVDGAVRGYKPAQREAEAGAGAHDAAPGGSKDAGSRSAAAAASVASGEARTASAAALAPLRPGELTSNLRVRVTLLLVLPDDAEDGDGSEAGGGRGLGGAVGGGGGRSMARLDDKQADVLAAYARRVALMCTLIVAAARDSWQCGWE